MKNEEYDIAEWLQRFRDQHGGTPDDSPEVIKRQEWEAVMSTPQIFRDLSGVETATEDYALHAPHPSDTPNLYVSVQEDGTHAPCIDIDIPCRLVPSKTPGHWHLFFEKKIGWEDYLEILRTMMVAGIVENGYYYASKKHGTTAVRMPPETDEFEIARLRDMIIESGDLFPEEFEHRLPDIPEEPDIFAMMF